MNEMTTSKGVAERREALGWTQAELAERVRALSGSKTFGQQSVDKLEKPGKRSRYMHYVLQALTEGEALIAGDRHEPVRVDKQDDPEKKLLEAVISQLEKAPPEKVRAVMRLLLDSEIVVHQQSPPTNLRELFEYQGIDEKEFFAPLREIIKEEVTNIVSFIERRQQRGNSPTGKERRDRKQEKQ